MALSSDKVSVAYYKIDGVCISEYHFKNNIPYDSLEVVVKGIDDSNYDTLIIYGGMGNGLQDRNLLSFVATSRKHMCGGCSNCNNFEDEFQLWERRI